MLWAESEVQEMCAQRPRGFLDIFEIGCTTLAVQVVGPSLEVVIPTALQEIAKPVRVSNVRVDELEGLLSRPPHLAGADAMIQSDAKGRSFAQSSHGVRSKMTLPKEAGGF
jgi:hypothetical protein